MVRVMLCASHLRRGEGEETLDWLSSLIGNSKNKFYPPQYNKTRDILSQESRYNITVLQTGQQSILNEYHHIVLYKGKAESNSIMVWCASANPLVDYSLHFPSRCKLSGGLSDSCKFRGYSGRGPLAALSPSL